MVFLRERGETLDVERSVQLGTVLGCARLSGSALAGALGIVLALLSFSNTIDGDSTQSCQTWPVILNQHSGSPQGLLPFPPDQFAGLCACEECYSSCHTPASSQTDQPASCANVSVLFTHLVLEVTFLPPSGPSCTLLPLSSPSFGHIFGVVLDFSQNRRCLWHGTGCSEVKEDSCGSLSPDLALF